MTRGVAKCSADDLGGTAFSMRRMEPRNARDRHSTQSSSGKEREDPCFLQCNTENLGVSGTAVSGCSSGVLGDLLSPSLCSSFPGAASDLRQLLPEVGGQPSAGSVPLTVQASGRSGLGRRSCAGPGVPAKVSALMHTPAQESAGHAWGVTAPPPQGAQGWPYPHHVIPGGIFPKKTWGTATRGKKWTTSST